MISYSTLKALMEIATFGDAGDRLIRYYPVLPGGNNFRVEAYGFDERIAVKVYANRTLARQRNPNSKVIEGFILDSHQVWLRC
eukprot:1381615-Amorphochlora_amoeboformis.AAC.1